MLKKGVFICYLPATCWAQGQCGKRTGGPALCQQAEASPHCEEAETPGDSWTSSEGGTGGASAPEENKTE